MVTEAPIENYVVEEAERAGWLVRKLSWVGRRAGPDRFFAKEGRVVLIEFKRPGKKAVGLQAKEHRLLKAAGVETHVCDSPLQALVILGVIDA